MKNRKKANKILMMTVSILLCLVLISSCMLSGIYAKYTVSQTAGVGVATIKPFGVEISMTIDDAKLAAVGATKKQTVNSNKAVSYTIENLKLKPGDDLTDLVSIHVDGTANVDCQVIIDLDFVYDYNEFTYGEKYMPYDFTCRIYSENFSTSSTFANRNLNNYEWSLDYAWILDFPLQKHGDMMGTYQQFTHKYHETTSIDYLAYKNFRAGSDIEFIYNKGTSSTADDVEVNDMKFGLLWPFDNGYDERDMYLSKNPDAKLELTFTVSVEQIQLPKETT